MKSVRVFSDSNEMSEEMARCWCEQSTQFVNNYRVFSVVLSGGSTDPMLYGKLAEPEWRNRIPWKSVHIFFADERCVSPDDEESNYKIVSHYLLNHIPIPETNIHRLRGEENPVKESFRYAEDIQNHLALKKEGTRFFDWVFLGVGLDGHTASLFPGHDLVNSRKLCEVVRHPETGQSRITMTPLAINNSGRTTYHVIGSKKAGIVSKLASNPSAGNIYPAMQIPGEWYLDQAAASNLKLL